MIYSKIQTKFWGFFKLMRLHSPAGSILLFLTCIMATFCAASEFEDLNKLGLFALGSFIMRSAGCIINDLWDKDIDPFVRRTQNRPLANGSIKPIEAFILLMILLMSALIILLHLNILAIIIGCIICIAVIIYPLMKRYTFWPQLFLGVTFNAGILLCYAEIRGMIDLSIIILYLGAMCWTVGYDTIYGFMDAEDDVKVGVRSSAILLRSKNYKLWLFLFYSIFIFCVLLSLLLLGMELKLLSIILLGVAYGILLWQVLTLDINDEKKCFVRFKSNQIVGLLICAVIIISKFADIT